jgi:hypothetical protein
VSIIRARFKNGEFFMKHLQNRFSVQLASLLLAIVGCIGGTQMSADTPDLPKVGVDSAGNKIAVWQVHADDDSYFVQSSYFRPGIDSNWSTPVTISDTEFDTYAPFIRMDSSGNAVAVWTVLDTTNGVTALAASMATVGGSWATPVMLTTANDDVYNYHFRTNDNGDVIVTWHSYNVSGNTNDIWTRTASFSSNNSWDTAVQNF